MSINKKLLLIILAIFSTLIILTNLYLYLKNGLSLTVNPKNAVIEINNNKYDLENGSLELKLEPGEYKLISYLPDYRKKEQTIKVKVLGKTKVNIDLQKAIQIPSDLPYKDPSGKFFISAVYDTYFEPEFIIYLSDNESENTALDWLKNKGVDKNNSSIKTILDFDEGEPSDAAPN